MAKAIRQRVGQVLVRCCSEDVAMAIWRLMM
jgi:hypothetical protein